MDPLTALVLLAFLLLLALFAAVWFTLGILRAPREQEKADAAMSVTTSFVYRSNDTVRGAKAPHKHPPLDTIAPQQAEAVAPVPYVSGSSRSRAPGPERDARVWSGFVDPDRDEPRASGPARQEDRTAGRGRDAVTPARPAAARPEPTRWRDRAANRPDVGRPSAPRFDLDRASGRGRDAARQGDETKPPVRVRERSREDREREEDAFARFLDPRRPDEF